MGDYNMVSRGYEVDLLSQKGLQVGLPIRPIVDELPSPEPLREDLKR